MTTFYKNRPEGGAPAVYHTLSLLCCSVHTAVKTLADCVKEVGRVYCLGLDAFHKIDKVFGHYAVVESVEACVFKLIGVIHKFGQTVKFAAFAKRTAPCEDGGHGISRGLFSFEMLVVMACHCAVCRLVLILADTSTEVIMASEPKAVDTISLITSPS